MTDINNIFVNNLKLNDKLNNSFLAKFNQINSNNLFKSIVKKNINDLEDYFKLKIKNINNFKKILITPEYNKLTNIELENIEYGFKYNKNLDNCFVILIFKTNSSIIPYCIISYKLNLLYSNNNIYCIFLKNWMEVILYLFKFENDIKNTSNYKLLNYPNIFYINKYKIINYFNKFNKIWRN